jgi:hypothetical protein
MSTSGTGYNWFHAALVMLAPVAVAALVGLYWSNRASRLAWEHTLQENKPLVRWRPRRGAPALLRDSAGVARSTELNRASRLVSRC